MAGNERLARIKANLAVCNAADPPFFRGPEDEAWASILADVSWLVDQNEKLSLRLGEIEEQQV